MIKIFTDSTSYIPADMAAEYNITMLPQSIDINGKIVSETHITNLSFYSQIRKDSKIPKTIPLSVNQIKDAFESEVKQGNTIIAIFISAKISATCKNAEMAKQRLITVYPKANITIVDSESAAMEEGLAVIAAAKGIKTGAWLEDIIRSTKDTIKHTKFLFVPDTLKYLEIGRRISKTLSLFGGALQITPLLCTKDGEIISLETIRAKKKAVDRIIEIFTSDIDKYGVNEVIVHHIDALDEALALKKRAENIARCEVSICDIGPVVGANVGPGAIGLVYRTVEEMVMD